jgi:hypothetical protein
MWAAAMIGRQLPTVFGFLTRCPGQSTGRESTCLNNPKCVADAWLIQAKQFLSAYLSSHKCT